jgi:hypothetical protein
MKTLLVLAMATVLAACGSDSSSNNGLSDSPNGSFATATPLALGTMAGDVVSSYSDFDYFVITVATGTINIQTFDAGGTGCNTAVDTTIDVYTGGQVFVSASDDSGLNYCEDFNVSVTAGTYYIMVGGWEPFPFEYRLRVTQL